MKTPPAGWPRLSVSIFYEDAAAALDWLHRAFGFEVRLRVDDPPGRIVHSELVFGEALVMVGSAGSNGRPGQESMVSPRATRGANTATLCVFVDDVDQHCARARAAGALIFREPETNDYGPEYWTDRSYGARDPEGHLWFFLQRLRTGGANA